MILAQRMLLKENQKHTPQILIDIIIAQIASTEEDFGEKNDHNRQSKKEDGPLLSSTFSSFLTKIVI